MKTLNPKRANPTRQQGGLSGLRSAAPAQGVEVADPQPHHSWEQRGWRCHIKVWQLRGQRKGD